MNLFIALFMITTIVTAGCGSLDNQSDPDDFTKSNIIDILSYQKKDPQKDPKDLVEAIFNAAHTRNYSGLATLIASDADAYCRRIAQVATDPATAALFQKYFLNGKINGEPIVRENKASVKILFGPEGSNEEIFGMIKKDDKWYLQTF